uniref:CW domain-containing protein n=1 Tax=Caenorhabditis tropicalis TaxID=1561998 RepID=A0A1I7UZF3_9PELO
MYSFTRFLAIISLIGMLSATDEMKLMLINGRVVGESLDEGIENVWCKETCYNLPNCILAFMDSHNHCILFDFNSTIQLEIEETQKTDGFVVAFKTWLPSDSCPIYSEMIPVVKIGEDTIPWTKGIIVCMKPFLNSTLYNIGLARSYCENLGYKLSGLATVAEVEWVLSRLYALRPISKDFDGLWIDGLRNCTQFCDTWLPSDSCPIYSEMVPVVKIGEDTIPWTKTSNKFNFLKCSGNWKQFDRSDGITVCIQPFSLNTASSITVARNYCENKGYKMSGLATIDEAQWVFEKMMQFFPNMNYWDGFWIDGRRNCSKPCNNFAFTDGYTVLGDIINKTILSWVTYEVYPEDCLQASNAAENLVNDVECGRTTGMFGVVCGYQVIE